MLLATAFAMALSTIPGPAIPGPALPEPALAPGATPEETLRSVLDGVNHRRAKAVVEAFEVSAPAAHENLTKLFNFQQRGPQSAYSLGSVSVDANGNRATARVKIAIKGPSQFTLPEETVKLIKVGGDWKIANQDITKPVNQGFYSSIAYLVRNPTSVSQAKQAAAKTVILSNLKQISTAILMYTMDQDGKFSLTTANLKSKLLPYLKTDAVFKSAEGKPLPVVFNANLTGKKDTDLSRPAETVLVTLGSRGNLVFTENVTPIAFADGHVKYLTRAQLSILRWIP